MGQTASEAFPTPSRPDTVCPATGWQGLSCRVQPDKDIAEIIRSGSVLGKAPIVSMPHWGTILSDQQIAQLIAYINTLS